MEIDKMIEKDESYFKALGGQIPKELDPCFYFKLIKKKSQHPVTMRNNTNPGEVVFKFFCTYAYFQKNHNRFQFIKSCHEVRNYGYELYWLSIAAHEEPINIEKKLKTEVIVCKRMITKLNNIKNNYDNKQISTLFPDFNDSDYLKLKLKIKNYHVRLSNAVNELSNYNK